MRPTLALCAAALLAACGETQFFAPPPTTSALRMTTAARTVMINEASIPEYGLNQEIPIQQADGSLTADTERLWADLPSRALQGSLTRQLNAITNAQVAPEPWPLSGFPEAEVTVFVDDMIVQANGTMRFTGTYAIASETGRDRVRTFAFAAPVAVPDSYVSIIAAHEAAWQQLAEQIARDL